MSDLGHGERGNESGGASKGERALNFIEQIIEEEIASGRWGVWGEDETGIPPGEQRGEGRAGPNRRAGKARVHTRFPPEPNGWLHIGHAKSICLNAGLARTYDGKFNLRFDDTNPTKEEMEYVEAIKRDVKWLGADYENPDWASGGAVGGGGGGGIFWASDYFDQMYEFAKELILKGKAYVCELSADEVAARRGTPSVPATSPFRDRPVDESMRLFREMKLGRHADGSMTLRAKIDLASPNFNLRDPVMYRIMHAPHHNTGTKWCIYPMYDWAHGLEDALEKVTHSICTLEFENHRPLYDWFIDAINEGRTEDGSGPWGTVLWHSRQIEFAKLIPTYTLLSKRNMLKMVQAGVVDGWDDPRFPTIAGMRRRGYTPESIRAFCDDIGVTKTDSLIDFGRLENAVREHLNAVAPRRMAVLRPLKVVVENYPEGTVEQFDAVNNPEDASAGSRPVAFTRELFIERDDFMEEASKKFFRMTPGQEVRLRWAYVVKCTGCTKDAAGNVTEVRCTYDPDTRGGDIPLGPDGKPTRKVQGTIHWVSAAHAKPAEVRLFDRLFTAEEPGARTGNPMDDLNPASLEVVQALVEPALAAWTYSDEAHADPRRRVQFERLGYFCLDRTSTTGKQVWNRVVTLKDAWAKEAGGGVGGAGAGKPGGKAAGAERTYTFGQAAHELKISKEKLTEHLTGLGVWAEVSKREPMTVRQSEFEMVRKLVPKK